MKKAIKITSGICIFLVLLLIGVGEYFLHVALSHDSSYFNADNAFNYQKKDFPWTAQWIDSIRTTGALRDTFVINREGVKLHAWYMPAQKSTGNTAVIVHGYKYHSVGMIPIAYMFHHDLEWNVLLPDLSGHGLSDGDRVQMGWNDRKDVAQWIKVAHETFLSDTLVVHGISMGAATTMCVSGDEQPPYVRGYIEDCGYTSVWDEFKHELRRTYHLPSFPLLNTASLLNKIQYGWSFTEASPIKQVAKCQKPMLFIHGDNDDYVPTWMVHPLYEAKPQPKELWLAPGSAHADAIRDHHEEYTQRVKEFLHKYIFAQ